MAARRLLIVMLVLLGISTLAAALVPTPDNSDDESGSSDTVSEATVTGEGTASTAESGRFFPPTKITVGGSQLPVVGSKEQPIRVGDQLALEVKCKCSDLVEIPAFGLVEAVAPGAPARFDLLFDTAGSFGLRLLGSDEVVGRIEVEEAKG